MDDLNCLVLSNLSCPYTSWKQMILRTDQHFQDFGILGAHIEFLYKL